MKGKTKIALSTLMTCLIIGNVGFAETVKNIEVGANQEKTYSDSELIVDFTGYQAVKVNGNNAKLQVDSNKISISTKNAGGALLNPSIDGLVAQGGGKVVLGNNNTNSVNINVDFTHATKSGWVTGVTALKNNSSVIITGKEVAINVNSNSGNAVVSGLWAQNSDDTVVPDDNAATSEIIINADNTIINVTADKKDTTGITNFSGGRVIINSNTEINADKVISTRGNAVTRINAAGENKVVRLNGNIEYNITNDGNSGSKADAVVDIRLTNEDSYFNGNIVKTYATKNGDEPANGLANMTVENMNLEISNGAQWNPDYVDEFAEDKADEGTVAGAQEMLAVDNLISNGGIINLENMRDQALEIENISGKKLNVNVASADNKLSITESNKVESLTVAANGTYAEELVKNDITDSLNNLANQVVDNSTTGKGKTAATDVAISETGVVGEITAQVGEDGKVDATTVKELTNSTTAGIGELANVAFMAWRAENDEMHQRMGELRSSTGEAGIWARMKRGESESGDLNIKNQYSTYQLGYDEKVGDSNWYLGGAISRTEGKSSFGNGSGENQSTGFTVYGTYVGEDGQYVDLSAKYARLDNEFDVFGRDGIESTGDYRNNGYAFSAEYGKRIEAGNDFWVEPQVQLTYGHLSSANYTTSRGIKAAQDAMNSVVGRVGFAAGKDISAGNVYVKASYLYDFDGDTSVTMNDGVNSRTYEQDLGGGWFEFGIGTNINLSETSHLYFDVERAVGGDIDTPWQWNAGVRFDF